MLPTLHFLCAGVSLEMGGAINISGIRITHSIFDRYSLRVHYITNDNIVYYPRSPIEINANSSRVFNYSENYGIEVELLGEADNPETRYAFPNSDVEIAIGIIADEYDESLVQFEGAGFHLDTDDQILKDHDIISASYQDYYLRFKFNIGTTDNIRVNEYPNMPFTADAEWRIGFSYDGVKYTLIWNGHFTTDFSY